MKNFKIYSTIGPGFENIKNIDELKNLTTDIRFNCSHDYKTYFDKFKFLKNDFEFCFDLKGIKFRIGRLDSKYHLEKGSKINFQYRDEDLIGNRECIYFNERDFIDNINKDEIFFLNDGKIKVKVSEKFENSLKCEVHKSGIIDSNKGINFRKKINFSFPTKKDRLDLEFANSNDIDKISVSFVQDSNDLKAIRKSIGNRHLIAKIERETAVNDIDNILNSCDEIWIARGDLGAEIGIENIGKVEEYIIRECKKKNIPVIIAGQVFDSLKENSTPLRAEVSSFYHLLKLGINGVVLSDETAISHDPINTLKFVNSILKTVD